MRKQDWKKEKTRTRQSEARGLEGIEEESHRLVHAPRNEYGESAYAMSELVCIRD